jgi:hypothetical protein
MARFQGLAGEYERPENPQPVEGMTDQVLMSRTPGSFKTVLVPRGSSKPEWLRA